MLKEITSKGYKGKISILRNYIRSFKGVNPEEPAIRFETEPGKQMQIDFVTVSGRKGERFKAFVATPGYSKAGFVKFYPNKKLKAGLMVLMKPVSILMEYQRKYFVITLRP